MNVKHETYKSIEQMPGSQIFPANISSLVLSILIIILTFTLSVLALFTY